MKISIFYNNSNKLDVKIYIKYVYAYINKEK